VSLLGSVKLRVRLFVLSKQIRYPNYKQMSLGSGKRDMKMSYSIYRRDFIRRGAVTVGALSAFSPARSQYPVRPDARGELRVGRDSATQNAVAETLRCSFCSKSQDDVSKLIAGPDVYICDECVDVCQEIISDDVIDKPDQTSPPDTKYVCSLCSGLSPAEQITIIRHRGVAVCKSCIDAILATLSEGR